MFFIVDKFNPNAYSIVTDQKEGVTLFFDELYKAEKYGNQNCHVYQVVEIEELEDINA